MINSDSMPIARLIPSMVTLFALCIGLTAVKLSFFGNFEHAIEFVVFACFLDGIDGRIARALSSTTTFGAELDSLCDFVNFGVGPGFILYFWYLKDISLIGWGLVLLISISVAIRLARFNVAILATEDTQFAKYIKKNFFVGVPSPVASCLFLLPVMLNIESGLILSNYWLILYLTTICILVVSRIPTLSFKNIKINKKHIPVFAIIFMAFVIYLFLIPLKTIIFGCFLYLTLIPFGVIFYLHKRKFYNQC